MSTFSIKFNSLQFHQNLLFRHSFSDFFKNLPIGAILARKSRLCFTAWRSFHLLGRTIPNYILLPPYIGNVKDVIPPRGPIQHSTETIACLRVAGSVVRDIFEALEPIILPGLTTQDIDDFVFKQCMSRGVYPSPLGYRGFPKSVCTSVNEVACHGIPSPKRKLQSGDLLSVDISIYTRGVHGDACRSYVVTSANALPDDRTKLARYLCAAALACRDIGVAVCSPGIPYSEIAQAVSYTADKWKCRVVAGICGHGLGQFLHGPPDIVHSVYEASEVADEQMLPGHVFTVEPCIALQSSEAAEEDGCFAQPARPVLPTDDGWTVVTSDRVLTAQFEHTLVVTDKGHEILT